jgi:hypothetical protein
MNQSPNVWRFWLVLIAAISPFHANAEGYLEFFLSNHDGQVGKNIYVEMGIGNNTSALLTHYEDPYYQSSYAGLTRKFGNLQLGLGLGEATYGGNSYFGYNPWLWYQEGDWNAYIEAEYLPGDKENYYYRGFLYNDISRYLSVGVYTERFVGTGPAIGLNFDNENYGVMFNLAKPVLNKPGADEEETDLVFLAIFWLTF